MKCEHAHLLMQEYLDAVLLPLDRAAVEEHVNACAPCHRELAQLQALIHVLEDLPPAEAPADFADGIMAALPEMLPAQQGVGHVVRWGLVAAAAVFAFVVGLAVLPGIGGPDVARDTLGPVSASFRLGGAVMSAGATALAGALDAASSALVSAGPAQKLAFLLAFFACNAALVHALRRYRLLAVRPSSAVGGTARG